MISGRSVLIRFSYSGNAKRMTAASGCQAQRKGRPAAAQEPGADKIEAKCFGFAEKMTRTGAHKLYVPVLDGCRMVHEIGQGR